MSSQSLSCHSQNGNIPLDLQQLMPESRSSAVRFEWYVPKITDEIV
jgi:hypothetical protein